MKVYVEVDIGDAGEKSRIWVVAHRDGGVRHALSRSFQCKPHKRGVKEARSTNPQDVAAAFRALADFLISLENPNAVRTETKV
jgi:hypothetical protein